jgi:tetratricopeptide (TPR) repeat protein
MLKHYAAIAIACTSVLTNALPSYAQTPSTITTAANSPARSSFDRGVAKFESGDALGAIKDLTAAIESDPKYVEAYIYRGVMQGIHAQKPDLAILDFDRAIKLDPQNSNAYAFRGLAKFTVDPKSNFKGDFDRAIQLDPQSSLSYALLINSANHNDRDLRQFAKLLRQQPNIFYYALLLGAFPPAADDKPRQFDTRKLPTAKAYLERGLDRLEDEGLDKRNINAAIADFNRAIALDAQLSDAYFYRSLFSAPGDTSKKNIDIDRAIALNPQPEQYYCLRGMFGMSENPYSVLNDLERGIAINPQSYILLGMRSFMKAAIYELEPAKADAIAAAKLARQQGKLGEYFGILFIIGDSIKNSTVDSNPNYIKLAKHQYRAGKKTEALATLAKTRATTEQQPKKSAEAYNQIAIAAMEMGDFSSATNDVNKAIKIDPNNISSLFLLARIRTKMNDMPGAIVALDRIIAISNKPFYLVSAAQFKLNKLNNAQSALTDLNKAIARNSKEAIFYLVRAEIKTKIGDKKGAAADYNLAIKNKPNLPILYINRAKFKAEHLQDKAGALTDYQKAISLDSKFASNVYVERGNTKRDVFKDFTSALADYDRAIATGEKDLQAQAYTERANLHRNYLKNSSRALADYDRAIDTYPSWVQPYYLRATLKHKLLNDRVGAIADYRSTIRNVREYDIDLEYEGLEEQSIEALKQLGATPD